MAEDWRRVYEALTSVDFRAFDHDTLVAAMRQFVQNTYPEEFSDWIASSEFVTKIEILAWLSQNLSYRVDLNSRENFLAVAERRESLIRLAQNVAFNVSRVRPAVGEVKIDSVRTNQQLFDSDGATIGTVFWADAQDPDWFEKFILVMNSALSSRTPYGKPLRKFSSEGSTLQLYRFNSLAPAIGSYPFQATVGGATIPFELVNVDLDPTTGVYTELTMDPGNAFRVLYRSDGLGNSSDNTGFFMPIRQGTTGYQDEFFDTAQSLRSVNVDVANINQEDVWVVNVDVDGTTITNWTKVDSSFGDNVAFNTLPGSVKTVYEVLTRTDDQVTVRFGDGKIGDIPVGRFRFWYRTSFPNPRVVRSSDISSKVVVIPYVSGGVVYNLTVTYSLKSAITSGAPTSSNEDIRTRANKVFFSHNRMVTGEDYNSFFLKDNSILKVKSVNRTYSGHGRSIPLNDPTGTYQSVRLLASDGRIYKRNSSNFSVASANVMVLSVSDLIDNNVVPVLAGSDKQTLYFQAYQEIPLAVPAEWAQDSIVDGQSRGRFTRNEITQPVGPTATDELKHVGADCLVRFGGPTGPLVPVNFVIGDGTLTDAVLMKGDVPDGSIAYSVYPALRQTLSGPEILAITAAIGLKSTFGIRWDQATETYRIITLVNIDTTSPFSLRHAGSTAGTNSDASWIVWIEYRPDVGQDDSWIVHDRGLNIFFESDRDVDFFYANVAAASDPVTGRKLFDTVTILRDNETRDSLLRQGVSPPFGNTAPGALITLAGNGIDADFPLGTKGVSPAYVFIELDGVIQVPGVDWSMVVQPGPDLLRFSSVPADGAAISVIIDPKAAYAASQVRAFVGDGATDAFDTGARNVVPENVLLFVAGFYQSPLVDYVTYESPAGADTLKTELPVAGGDPIVAYVFSGPGALFDNHRFAGDGVTTDFPTRCPADEVQDFLVFVNGVLQLPAQNFVLETGDPANTIVKILVPPAIGTHVDVRLPLFPDVTRVVRTTLVGDGVSTTFATGARLLSSSRVLCWVDGMMKPVLSYTSAEAGDTIGLGFAPALGDVVHVVSYVVLAGADYVNVGDIAAGNPNLVFASTPTFLATDVDWAVTGSLYHDDGYTNPNGIRIGPPDADTNAVVDDPFMFHEFVIENGTTDLVLWRKVVELGAEIWQPISPTTQVRGTYTTPKYQYFEAEEYDPEVIANGSIHYDVENEMWLVADPGEGAWIEAPDQSQFRFEIGRGGLRFMWQHYAPDAHRIDPSASNIIDTFALTSSFDTAVRQWIAAGGVGPPPEPSTTDQLRIQFQDFENYKMESDAVIWHPGRYKYLFGPQALPELQATFQVVRTPTSTIPDNDLKLRVLGIVDDYFAVGNWDFGDSFFYTELAAFIHKQLSTIVQSVVVVPKADGQHFGRLFQVRAEPDELFISTAAPADVSIVDSLTDTSLRIGR